MQGDGALTIALDPAVEAILTDATFAAANQKSSINGAQPTAHMTVCCGCCTLTLCSTRDSASLTTLDSQCSLAPEGRQAAWSNLLIEVHCSTSSDADRWQGACSVTCTA